MHEIDLIPPEWQAARRQRRGLRAALLAGAALLLALAAGRAGLAWSLAHEQPALAQLRLQAQRADAQRKELLSLQAQLAQARERADRMARLRTGVDHDAAATAVDAAWSARVWLERLALSPQPPAEPVLAAGTALASASAASSPPRPVGSLLELSGHALDNAALSDFMQTLSRQPGISALKLTRTGQRHYETQDVVDFELQARLAAPASGSPP